VSDKAAAKGKDSQTVHNLNPNAMVTCLGTKGSPFGLPPNERSKGGKESKSRRVKHELGPKGGGFD